MKKKQSNIFYYFWSGAIILSLVLVVFALIFASCSDGGEKKEKETASPPASTDTPMVDPQNPLGANGLPLAPSSPDGVEPNAPDVQNPPQPAASTLLGETEDMGQEYIDKIVFYGDSTTYGLYSYNIVGPNQVWTPEVGTLTLDHWSYTAIDYHDTDEQIQLADALQRKQPEYLIITLGVNGISFLDEESFTATYTALVEKVQETSPNTKIILNSIYPVAASYKNLSSINNDKIDAANDWIYKIAENTGTRFLNTNPILKGEDGFLPESSQSGDGLHLTPATYEVIIDYIRTHGYK